MSTVPLKRSLSKNKKSTREERLKQTLKKKIDRHAERKELIDKLLTNSMSNDTRDLLKSSSTLGKKETNKEALERTKIEEKLAIKNLPEDRFKRKPKEIQIEHTENVVDDWGEVDDQSLIAAKQPVTLPSFFKKKDNNNNANNNKKNNKNSNNTSDGLPTSTMSLASLASLSGQKELKIITSLDDIDDDEESNQYEANKSNNGNGNGSSQNDERYVSDDLPKKRRGLVVPKKTADVKREEKSKKKYFFWSQDSIDRDFDEYDDDQLVSTSIKSKTVHKDNSVKDKDIVDKDLNELDESEDEETVNLKGNTGNLDDVENKDQQKQQQQDESIKEEKVEDKKKVKSNNKNNVNLDNNKETEVSSLPKNNNKKKPIDNKRKGDQLQSQYISVNQNSSKVEESTNNEKVTKKKKRDHQQKKEQQQQQQQNIEEKEKEEKQQKEQEDKKDEVDRYNITLDEFGKFEDENREFILSMPTGGEMMDKKIKETLEMDVDIEYNVFHVPVKRLEEVIESREKLPIMMEEHNIVEKIKDNDVVIICGETGSGKTTQVPQFLFESGFAHPDSDFPGLIGVTQPRRVAAVSTAKRVAHELNVVFGKEVGYQIRYDRHLDSEVNKVKFMTDGILLREVQTDFLLQQYSCIIIDEAHERNLNTDILIGLLSRIVPMRKKLFLNYRKNGGERYTPLKIVIMSATLRVEDFTKNSNLFNVIPPVINIPTRQYPVTIHFNKKTVLDNYIDEAYRKVLKIHRRLPGGGILVFVTGRQEVEELCAKLRRAHPMTSVNRSFKEANDKLEKEFKELGDIDKDEQDDKHTQVYGDADSAENQLEDINKSNNGNNGEEEDNELDFDDIEVVEDEDVEVESEDEDDEEEKDDEDKEEEKEENGEDDDDEEKKVIGPLHVLPLFSNMPTVKQMRVFQTPPLGSRLVVVATNLAETSLTIPNIKYVVDTGRVKGRYYNKDNGVSSFEVTWTSKASADQRAGRAGRTGPGHCYRIFSSAVYNDHFEQFSKPEILLIPIDGMVLQMKSMGIHNITRFPFPTPPEEQSLKLALRSLCFLGALDMKKNYDITELGQLMSTFPVSPRFSKMLLLGRQQGCLSYIIAIVAILTVKNPFVADGDLDEEEQEQPKPSISEDDQQDRTEKEMEEKVKEERKKRQQRMKNSMRKWIHNESDILTILKVVGAYDFQKKKEPKSIEKFCENQYLNSKSMGEIYKLRHQLSEIVNSIFLDEELNLNANGQYQPITMDKPMAPPTATQELFIKQVVTAGLIDQVARIQEVATSYSMAEYRSCTNNVPIFIHPSSNLSKSAPPYVVYCDVIETSKPYMKLITEVNPSWLAELGRPLCADFKPLDMPFPKYSAKRDKVICYIKPSFGAHSWELPLMSIDHPDQKESSRYFAKALLDGVVFSPLTYLIPLLNTRSDMILLPNTQSKVHNLVDRLRQFNINTKVKLAEKWFEDPQFLLKEYLAWLDQSMSSVVSSIWPPFESVVIPDILKVDLDKPSSLYETDDEMEEDE